MNENEIKDSKGFAALMRLIRPKQWIKNMFIFVPLFFGGALFHTDALLAGLIAFFAYSFAASSIYCFNDIHDVEADRRHSVKCHRPINGGMLSARFVGDDGNHRLLLGHEPLLLRQAQAVCHHRCVHRGIRICAPLAGRWRRHAHHTQ